MNWYRTMKSSVPGLHPVENIVHGLTRLPLFPAEIFFSRPGNR